MISCIALEFITKKRCRMFSKFSVCFFAFRTVVYPQNQICLPPASAKSLLSLYKFVFECQIIGKCVCGAHTRRSLIALSTWTVIITKVPYKVRIPSIHRIPNTAIMSQSQLYRSTNPQLSIEYAPNTKLLCLVPKQKKDCFLLKQSNW